MTVTPINETLINFLVEENTNTAPSANKSRRATKPSSRVGFLEHFSLAEKLLTFLRVPKTSRLRPGGPSDLGLPGAQTREEAQNRCQLRLHTFDLLTRSPEVTEKGILFAVTTFMSHVPALQTLVVRPEPPCSDRERNTSSRDRGPDMAKL